MGIVIFFILAFAAIWLISAVFHVAFALMLPAILWMLAGMFAGRIMRGRGYGPIVDILLGLAGGIVGRWLFGLLGVSVGGGVIASLVVGTIGAVVLVYLGRLLGGNRRQLA
jgi:uncharacterized membrane protein YeaQ/YmgE (transglycosylase-associated protein family)